MGWDKNEPPEFIGASSKRTAAERMRQAASDAGENNVPVSSSSQIIPVTVIFVLAAGFAALLLEGARPGLSGWMPAGMHDIDQLLAGASVQKITGDADLDRLIVILVRGAALFLATGIVPFLAAAAARIVGKNRLNPFVACWGVLISLPLFYLLWGGS